MNTNKHIWEGWTVQDFINELTPVFNIINRVKKFKSKEELKNWVKDNQPYYKKHIPEVYKHFLNKTNL